jgi:multidrug resistance efflux pump
LQAELDKQLADYEAVRAEWEIFNLKHPQVTDDVTKYLKTAQQARLNVAVKEVELAKYRLDAAALVCPVTGIITDDGGNRAGLYVTPAGNAIKILDRSSMVLELELTFDKLPTFVQPRKAKIKIAGEAAEYTGETSLPMPADKKHFLVLIPLPEANNLLPGIPGEAEVEF